jgi:predicted nicotinamide N-methyase
MHHTMVELGAGVGLVGLVACHLAAPHSNIVLTDHDPGVLTQIDANIAAQHFPSSGDSSCCCESMDLEWGVEGAATASDLISQLGCSPTLVLGYMLKTLNQIRNAHTKNKSEFKTRAVACTRNTLGLM